MALRCQPSTLCLNRQRGKAYCPGTTLTTIAAPEWPPSKIKKSRPKPVPQVSGANEPPRPAKTVEIPARPVAVTRSLTNGDQTVLLALNSILAPATTYTLTIQGVKSLAGVQMTSPLVITFTTGTGATLTNPTLVSATPVDAAEGVLTSVTPTVSFSAPMNPVSVYSYVTLKVRNTGTTVPATYTWSPDYRTVTLTPQSTLLPSTQYSLSIGDSNLTDQAGNTFQAGTVVNNFTTQ